MTDDDWAVPDSTSPAPPPRDEGVPSVPPSPPPPPPPAGWQPPGAPPPWGPSAPTEVRTNGFAVASLVLGLLWIWGTGSILAVVFGYHAKNQIRRSGEAGRGFATAGIVLGWIGIGILALLVIVLLVTAGGGSDYWSDY